MQQGGQIMASDLHKVMTRDEAIEEFQRDMLPFLILDEARWQGGEWSHVDAAHRREAWNNWTDALCKDRRISDWQYENWSQPECCEG